MASSGKQSIVAQCRFNGGTGALIGTSRNVTSVSDGGASGMTVNFTNAIPSGSMPQVTVIATPGGTAATALMAMVGSISTTQLLIYCVKASDGTAADPTEYVVTVFAP